MAGEGLVAKGEAKPVVRAFDAPCQAVNHVVDVAHKGLLTQSASGIVENPYAVEIVGVNYE